MQASDTLALCLSSQRDVQISILYTIMYILFCMVPLVLRLRCLSAASTTLPASYHLLNMTSDYDTSWACIDSYNSEHVCFVFRQGT